MLPPPHHSVHLQDLPGVGDYPTKATRVFAFGEPEILIETNIHSAFIYHFFRSQISDGRLKFGNWKVRDSEIFSIARRIVKSDPSFVGSKTWHWALMDYGAHLKQSGVRVNMRSAHYTKQSKFEGSLRQVRGAILNVIVHNQSIDEVQNHYADNFDKALASLARDGLIVRQKGKRRIE